MSGLNVRENAIRHIFLFLSLFDLVHIINYSIEFKNLLLIYINITNIEYLLYQLIMILILALKLSFFNKIVFSSFDIILYSNKIEF